jgi:branched-chain amino acid transport system substrate-binding protein
MKLKTLTILACSAALALGFGMVSAQTDIETLSIAVIGKQEGEVADTDQEIYQAAILAAEQINAGENDDEEGILSANGTRYDLNVVFYAAENADDVADALEDATNDGALAVISTADSEVADALATANSSLPIFFTQSSATEGTRLYRLSSTTTEWTQASADYLVNNRQFTKLAVVTSNTDTALENADTFNASTADDLVLVNATIEADTTDFSSVVSDIEDNDVEAIFTWLLDDQMISFLTELRASGWEGVVIYGGLDSDFLADAGDLTNGLYGLNSWFTGAFDSASQGFVADYTTRWGAAPSYNVSGAYDAIYLLEQAITEANDEVSAIVTQLNGLDYAGVQGNYADSSISSVRFTQVIGNTQIEVARYQDAVCVTCPQIFWANTQDDSATSTQTFNIGLITTLNGVNRENGDNIESAVQLAIRQINEQGGVIQNNVRYSLNLTVYSATTTEEARTMFEQAIRDGMQIILGPDYNAQIVPNLNGAANANSIQFVSATADQIAFNDANNTVYQLRATDTTMAQATAEYLLNVRDFSRFATVAVRTDYGLDSIESFKDVVNGSDDGRVTLELEHAVDDMNVAPIVESILGSDAEVVALWTTQAHAFEIAKQLSEAQWQGTVVYGFMTPDFAAQLSGLSIEVLSPVNWWMSAQDWTSNYFVDQFTSRYGVTPLPQSASYYDAVYMIANAIAQFGTTTDNLQSWLTQDANYVGVQGVYSPSTFGTGELSRMLNIVSVNAGQLTSVARYNGNVCLTGCE